MNDVIVDKPIFNGLISDSQPAAEVSQNCYAAEEIAMSCSVPAKPMQKRIGLRELVETIGTGVFLKACGFVQGILIVRALGGPAGCGEFETAKFWPVFLACVGMLGADMAIKRRAAKETDIGKLTRTVFLLSLMLSFVTVAVSYFLLPFLIPKDQSHLLPYAVIFLAFIPINNIALNLLAIDEGTGHFRRFNIIRAILNPVTLLGIALVWLAGYNNVKWFLIVLLLANFVVLAVRWVIAIRSYGIRGPIYNPFNIIGEALPFWLTRICSLVWESTDRILLIWLLGPAALGFYVVAMAGSGLLTMMGVSANTIVFAMSAQAQSRQGFDRVAKVFRCSAVMWLFMGVCMVAVIPWAIPMAYGRVFTSSVHPAIILIFGTAMAMQARLLDLCLQGQGRILPGITGKIATIIIMAVTALTTYQKFAYLGITYAFVLAQTAYLCIMIAQISRYFGKTAVFSLVPGMSDVRELWARFGAYFSRRFQRDVA